jgi:hypothetical protein
VYTGCTTLISTAGRQQSTGRLLIVRVLHRVRRHPHGSRASSVAGGSPRSGAEDGGGELLPRRGSLTRDSSAHSLAGCRSDGDQS